MLVDHGSGPESAGGVGEQLAKQLLSSEAGALVSVTQDGQGGGAEVGGVVERAASGDEGRVCLNDAAHKGRGLGGRGDDDLGPFAEAEAKLQLIPRFLSGPRSELVGPYPVMLRTSEALGFLGGEGLYLASVGEEQLTKRAIPCRGDRSTSEGLGGDA